MTDQRSHQTLAMGETPAATRPTVNAPFGTTLVEAARQRDDIIGLSADLAKYTDMLPFKEEFPHRFFNVGMAEQNLIGVAGGLARAGYLPVATTYAVFATRRAYDFIAIDCALTRANVKIVAGLPGLTTGYGGTHQGIDDLAMMRAMPNMVVLDPADAVELEQATRAAIDHRGPVYMRLQRADVPLVLDPTRTRFEIGRATLVSDGSDVGIVACGIMVERAIEAARRLAERGISAAVLSSPSIKPFDHEAVLRLATETGALVAAENHSIIGGLGAAIAETLTTRDVWAALERVGIQDEFGECGSLPYLAQRHGLTIEAVVAAAERAVERKQSRRHR